MWLCGSLVALLRWGLAVLPRLILKSWTQGILSLPNAEITFTNDLYVCSLGSHSSSLTKSFSYLKHLIILIYFFHDSIFQIYTLMYFSQMSASKLNRWSTCRWESGIQLSYVTIWMWEHREITLSMSPQWPKLSDVYVKADFTVKNQTNKKPIFICVCVRSRQTDMDGDRERERERVHVRACGG